MRYYVISGEASGDLHGANIIKNIFQLDPQAEVKAWGGEKMEKQGATLVKHYKELAFMGFLEVITHLPEISKNIKFCKQDIKDYEPDVIILIDYPGFNLRIATWAKKQGFKVAYYISPQVWAWKENRVKEIKKSVHKMFVILPFEKEFYKKHQYNVTFVGHPLVEIVLEELLKPTENLSSQPIIALLPGSRTQEIKKKLPVMLKIVDKFPDYQFVIAKAPGQEDQVYLDIIGSKKGILLKDETYNLLKQAKAALVTSGTATLETALFGVPQIVCYKGNPFSYLIAKYLIKVKYISLVNLILDKPAVKELIQDNFNSEKLAAELHELLTNDELQDAIQSDYTLLWEALGYLETSQIVASEIKHLAAS